MLILILVLDSVLLPFFSSCQIITWCVFAIIFGSIIYYGMVFVAEVFGYTPKCLMKCFASKKSLAAMRNADKLERGDAEMKVKACTAYELCTLEYK